MNWGYVSDRWLCERREVASRAERRGNRADAHEYALRRRRRDRPRGWPAAGVCRPPGWPPRGWRR
ncbi:hypothetical protein [Amycolatopsis sp. NPDC049159]|uniref:hypothetical protein n=1 Tax=Amycolatopsis sp. NPDC049159 TaxID=3157210 RepID=UPI0033ECAF56